MTESTNQCNCHKKIEKTLTTLEHEIDDKVWPVIRSMVQWKHFLIIGSIIVGFGLILIGSNASGITETKKDVQCLQSDINTKFEQILKAVEK